ncbi:MAG: tetratricopeptide repeat protein [Patescibacteria group bacterium]|nr:tetratricopeptide repeat protein [Patescibacteria group bacterium]
MVSAILTEKDLDHALSIAEDMTEQYPESARAWNGLGWVYLERNELNQAQEALARAESIDPSVAYLSDNKADLAEKQARPTDSVEESHAPQTAGGTDLVEPVETPVIEKSARQVILELQDALLQDSDAIAAIELGIEATEKDATNVETWNALGWAYIEAGRYEDAQISLEKARSIDASFSKIYLNLGNLFRAQEDMEMALSHYRLAIEHEGQVESFVSKEAQKQINRILLSQEKQSSNTGDISQDTGEFVEVTQEDLVEIYEVQEEINIQTIWQIFKQYFESLFGFMR